MTTRREFMGATGTALAVIAAPRTPAPEPVPPPPTIKLPPANPLPASMLVAHVEGPDGGDWTAVARSWRPGDARRCRRCPAGCTVSEDGTVCLIVYPGHLEGPELIKPPTRLWRGHR